MPAYRADQLVESEACALLDPTYAYFPQFLGINAIKRAGASLPF